MKKLIWIFFIGVIAYGAVVGYLKSHHFTNLDPKDAECFVSDPIVMTREISIPGFRKAYNPGLIEFGDGYLLTFRVNHFDLKSYVKHLLQHKVCYLGIVELDRNFELIGKPRLINCPDNTIHDARMVRLNEKIYLLFNRVSEKNNVQKMFIGELVEKQSLENVTQLSYLQNSDRVEKNWTPFVHNEKLYVFYQIAPTIILEVNPDTGMCTEIVNEALSTSWPFGHEVRGGTPGIFLDNAYISFFHSSKEGVPSRFSKKHGQVYFMGAFLFEPFKVTHISAAPLATKSFYEKNAKNVVFPTGIAIDGNLIHVVWGKDDEKICLTTFDKQKLLKSLL